MAYGIKYYKLRTNAEAEQKMPEILAERKAVLIEVMTDPMEKLGPKAASKQQPDGSIVSMPLEDMEPFIEQEMLKSLML